MERKKLSLYDGPPQEVEKEVEKFTQDFLEGTVSGRECLSLMLQGRIAASPEENVSYVTNQDSLNIPGKILPPFVNKKPKGKIQQSYSFSIFNGLMNFYMGTAHITQEILEEQSRKNLEQKSEYFSDGMHKPGLTQIFKINTQYKRR